MSSNKFRRMNNLPIYIPSIFILTVIICYCFFIISVSRNNTIKTTVIVSAIVLIWLSIQYVLAKNNFYFVVNTFPPRLSLLILPPLLMILLLFISVRGRRFIDSLPTSTLTLMHIVRIFIEIILFKLFIYRFVPILMTFEGRNFDILAGLSAPLVFYFGYVKKSISKGFLIAWNIIAMLLLFNVVVIAVFSAPSTFQKLAFLQPNIAIQYFPFVWLPSFVVPLVLFAHLVTLRKLFLRSVRG